MTVLISLDPRASFGEKSLSTLGPNRASFETYQVTEETIGREKAI